MTVVLFGTNLWMRLSCAAVYIEGGLKRMSYVYLLCDLQLICLRDFIRIRMFCIYMEARNSMPQLICRRGFVMDCCLYTLSILCDLI